MEPTMTQQCDHWKDTPEESRYRYKHINKDGDGDCPIYFGCCGDCANGMVMLLIKQYMEFVNNESVEMLRCTQGPEEHTFPSFVQFRILELEDIHLEPEQYTTNN